MINSLHLKNNYAVFSRCSKISKYSINFYVSKNMCQTIHDSQDANDFLLMYSFV